ncbi:MAG TPA: hypothetical protein VJ739_02995 [Gemmataceae bacterium]|nr:hypothetical protein [Gemmataceae bacterium]
MAVHTQEGSLKVLAMIFEARYDEGYRFLDHAGELLVRIKRHRPSWAVLSLAQKTVSLVHQELHLLANIGVEKIDVSVTERLGLLQADKQARILGDAAEEFYNLALEVLKIPRTTRVGTRFAFLAPSDSLEEADRFMRRAASSPMLDAVVEQTKSEAREGQFVYVLDDLQSGHRRRVTLLSAVIEQKPEDPPFVGLPGDSGSGGVAVDLDTYTRPEEAHFAKVSMFVQENYGKSRSQARGLFTWLLSQQK